eukprot:534864_1
MIDELAKLGYSIKEEVVRIYVSELMKDKNMDEEKLENILRSKECHEKVLKDRMKRESNVNKKEIICLDRGVVDSLAYFELNNHSISKYLLNTVMKHINMYRYKYVFILEKIPIVIDGVRHESEEERNVLHQLLIKHYNKSGYNLIFVPLMPIQKRIKFILQYVEQIKAKL